MSETLRTMVLILIFAGIMSIQYNLDADRTANRQIKNALELAVHDAALALDETQMAQGRVVFDQALAKAQFKASLENNLLLESSTGIRFTPKDDSFYQEDIMVEHFEFIDDSNATFSTPYLYNNPDYDIIDRLDGPSIIVVLTTRSPRYFAGTGIIIRKAVVYEYFH